MGRRKDRTALTTSEKVMVRVLLRNSPVTHSEIATAVWGCKPGAGPIDVVNTLRYMIAGVRPLLHDKGIRIITVPGEGYHIELVHQRALDTFLASTYPRRPRHGASVENERTVEAVV